MEKRFEFKSIVSFLLILIPITLNFIFFENNESSVLVTARAFFSPDFIKNDWWLSTGIEYGNLFNYFAGGMYELIGYTNTYFIGRLIVYFCWSGLLWTFFKRLKISPFLYPLLICVIQKNQTMGFGEWMLSGFETKTFAYLSFFMALLMFRKGYIKTTSFLFGLSVSFHILVGFYLTISTFLVSLIYQEFRQKFYVNTKNVAFNLLSFTLGAIFGILALLAWIKSGENISDKIYLLGSMIYTTKRVAHHVMFKFNGKLIFFSSIIFLMIFYFKNKVLPTEVRLLLRVATWTSLFLIPAYILTKLELYQYLKYYFARVPDALIPFVTITLGFAIISNLICRLKNKAFQNYLMIFFVLSGLGRSAYKMTKGKELWELKEAVRKDQVFQWIKKKTKKTDTFLILPTDQSFYVNAQRPIFVAFKHSPQKEVHLVEWMRRLQVINGGKSPGSQSWSLQYEVAENLKKLKEDQIKKIMTENNLQYAIFPNTIKKNLNIAFASQEFTVYQP